MSDTKVIAVFGDWHGDIQFARLAINSAAREGAKTLVHVGDWGVDWPGPKRGLQDTRLNKVLAANDQLFLLSPGNHDCVVNTNKLPVDEDGLITWRSNIKILPKGGRTVIAGLRVGALGGAYSVDRDFRTEGRDFWEEDEEPTSDQAEQLVAGGPVDILVTHDAPIGVPVKPQFDLPPDIVERADQTRILLRDVVDRLQPGQVFCGHHHQRVIHEIEHGSGRITRVDMLGKEHDREGNGVIVRIDGKSLQVEPLLIRGLH